MQTEVAVYGIGSSFTSTSYVLRCNSHLKLRTDGVSKGFLPWITLEGLFDDCNEVHEGGVDRSDVVRVGRTDESLVGILFSWIWNNVGILRQKNGQIHRH
jgi:hypothetical protein